MDNLAQELSSSKERLHNITEEYGEDTEKVSFNICVFLLFCHRRLQASSALHAIGKILFESGQYSESEKYVQSDSAVHICKELCRFFEKALDIVKRISPGTLVAQHRKSCWEVADVF